MILNCVYLMILCVFVSDYARFFFFWEEKLGKWLGLKNTPSFKLLDCSLCQTFWTTLMYMVISQGTLQAEYLAIATALAFSTKITLNAMYLIEDGFIWLFEKIRNILK